MFCIPQGFKSPTTGSLLCVVANRNRNPKSQGGRKGTVSFAVSREEVRISWMVLRQAGHSSSLVVSITILLQWIQCSSTKIKI